MLLTMSLMLTACILQVMEVVTDSSMNNTNGIHAMESEFEDDDDEAENNEAEVKHDTDESNEDDDRKDGTLRTACKLFKLDNLDGVTLTGSLQRLINVVSYGKMKKLSKFKMRTTLLENLLKHWIMREEGDLG